MARLKDKNSRRSKAERKKAEKAANAVAKLAEKGDPNCRVQRRRAQFSFLGSGMIDQDICDGIGQLHALGLLNGHGHTALELRNVGRTFAELWDERWGQGDGWPLTAKTGQFERRSRGTGNPPPRSKRDDLFDRLDDSMPRVGMERTALHMLLTEFYHSDAITGWAQRLINLELAKRGAADTLVVLDSETEGHDRHMLKCAIRGLCLLIDASLPARFQRAA